MSEPDLSTNGHPPEEDPILAPLIARLDALRAEEQHLQGRLDELATERKRFERGLAALTGVAPGRGRQKGGTRGVGYKVRDKPSGLSEDRMELIRDAIRKISEDKETFRQVDIRTSGLAPGLSSGVIALAFKALRDENFIRLVKHEGQNKWFRLTREAAEV